MQLNPRFIKRLLTLVSLTAIAWVIYRLYSFENWGSFVDYLSNNRSNAVRLLIIQITLLFINLSLESRKWQLLIAPVANISLKKSLFQVLKGIQMGMITPARTGDPIGKSVFYPKPDRWKVVLLSFSGSTIQSAVIFGAALLGLLTMGTQNSPLKNMIFDYYSNMDSHWLWIIGGLFIITLLFLAFHPRSVHFIKKSKKHLMVFKEYNISNIIQIVILTVLRYITFSFQFYLLLSFFAQSNFQNGFLSVFIYYGALSFLPSTGTGDLGLRASLALIIFGNTTLAGPAIIMASLLLWFFNLGLPALLPSFYGIPAVFKQKFQKEALSI